MQSAASHPSQKHVHALSDEGSWLKVWDFTLEKGVFGTNNCGLAMLRVNSQSPFHIPTHAQTTTAPLRLEIIFMSPCHTFCLHILLFLSSCIQTMVVLCISRFLVFIKCHFFFFLCNPVNSGQ